MASKPQPSQPKSLKATYAAAERQREAIERGAFHPGGSNNSATSYGDAVADALAAYEQCARRVAALAIFSTNESADDIATSHLPYLLVPFRVAELVQKLPAPHPGSPTERRALLRRARESYEHFLHHLDGYGLLAAPYSRLLQAYTEDPEHFSTMGGTTGTTRLSGTGPAAALMDPAARRNAKIANFRAEKELRGKLDVLRQRQQERRERRRRQRQRIREQEGEDTTATKNGQTDEEDDDDDDDDEDEEEARKLYLAQLAYAAHMAFQGLEGLNVEDEVLAQAPVPLTGEGLDGLSPPPIGGLGDNRQRGDHDQSGGYSDRLDSSHLGPTPVLRRLQSALGAGAVANTGPLLTADGKPRQPFTILGSRAEIGRNVFRPGHNLPTMSIDEYLAEERKRGGIIEGGGPSSGLPAEPDEDNYEKADAETMKARAWDEFTEANPRGAGNTLNRG